MTAQYSYDETAAELKMSVRWLKANLHRLPHLKFGEGPTCRVWFTDEHIAEIRAMHEVRPEPRGFHPIPSRRGGDSNL